MKTREKVNEIKNQKGITLIALVVTIVVLLILAGVSLNLVLGNNGIISKAQDAKVETRAGVVDDEVNLWKTDNYLAYNTSGAAETDSQMIVRLKENKLITEDDEVDTENKKIIIKKKDGTVVREISYEYEEATNVKINISKTPATGDAVNVLLEVSSLEGVTSIENEKLEETIDKMSLENKKAIYKNLAVLDFNNSFPEMNLKNFTELFNFEKENNPKFPYQSEEEFWNNFVEDDLREELLYMVKKYFYNDRTNKYEMYEIINPVQEVSDRYIAEVNGEYTFKVKDFINDKIYSKTVTVDNININIFKYTKEGIITGIKDEYLINVYGINKTVKLGIIKSTNSIKVAEAPVYKLVDELNGVITIPEEIEGTKIIGIEANALANIENLEKVTINAKITEIGEFAFSGCSSLVSINIPDSVVRMGNYIFDNCSLVTVKVPFKEGMQPTTWNENWSAYQHFEERINITYKDN